jgi:streptogramin lyase
MRTRIPLRVLAAGAATLIATAIAAGPAQAASGQITEFAPMQGSSDVLPSSAMTLGSDGDLYFGSSIESTNETGGQGAISRITPSGQVTTFTDADIASTNVDLTAIGPDHNVWFASNGQLGNITSAGQITTFSIPSFDGQPHTVVDGIVAGSDGNMWFTATAGTDERIKASFIGQVNPATGAVTEFPIPASSGVNLPAAPTLGSDGNIWFTLENNTIFSSDVARVSTS